MTRKNDYTLIVRIGLVSLLIAILLRTFVVQAYRVSTSSMQEALYAGDFFLVNKLAYKFKTQPQPGDIVIFTYPLNPDKNFVKRCIAVEGQTLKIINKAVYLDGKPYIDP